MDIESIEEMKPGTEKVNKEEAIALCNQVVQEGVNLIINKLSHIQPAGMFLIGVNAAVHILTSLFGNALYNVVEEKNHESFKLDILSQVSESLEGALNLHKGNKNK